MWTPLEVEQLRGGGTAGQVKSGIVWLITACQFQCLTLSVLVSRFWLVGFHVLKCILHYELPKISWTRYRLASLAFMGLERLVNAIFGWYMALNEGPASGFSKCDRDRLNSIQIPKIK